MVRADFQQALWSIIPVYLPITAPCFASSELLALSLLVLTGFAQPADRLAGATGTRLVLLHVQRDAILDPEQLSGTLADLDTEAINLAFTSLERGLKVRAPGTA